jgi:signal transduction histidine kinase/ActR/RegA family two-component response regulator
VKPQRVPAEQELDYRSLFEAAPGPFVVLTPDQRIVAATDAYLRATMSTREKILDRRLADVFPANAAGRPVNTPVRGPGGELRYIIQRVEDVTDFARLSHELRTPLTAILGFARMLETRISDAPTRETVDQIGQAGRQLLTLINDVLDISRIESGRLSFTPGPVQLGDAIRGVLSLSRPLAVARRVEMLTAGEAWHERHVRADKQRLHQALLNLVSNGIKYNRMGGRLTIACRRGRPGHLRIAVRDTGFGIPRALQSRLFTPFDRLGAAADGVEGTGLGLILVKRLVEAMDGRLGWESAEGEGSTFWIELPETAGSAAVPQPGTVLYIEDNPTHLEMVQRALAGASPVRFIGAMRGRRGLALAREHRPDVILTDMHLPDISGEEILQAVQSDPRLRPIPVIVLSADATPAHVRKLLAAGARAYLTKPPDVHRLLQTIEKVLPSREPP